ncbi:MULTISPECIES: hypothetical protein [unclassified Variovorax]|uniref:hypothetical protein n=1 Tax=unclassified Variovorax TaxID=663243 RepID=UPI00076CD2D9|nr:MULTISPECIES: hypothetical protein [unclassified Variovorax]KWT98298.1 Type II secretory pathway component PulD-like protein [Variovorax sp. WDL1]PNG50047.1 hypothetical protein CHC06_05628 [Variovorax sp. B2]PNG50919.1 hypothetical protein CHC07_05533 [Variovorax sp. B4]VTU41584.1 pilus (MSHA type) biogenesis protein MshL [Variovorax sp. SRS16]VTU41615.1 pilus (MSHA type) biogenesis protein MshL [Variovorax sp. PBL-E5]
MNKTLRLVAVAAAVMLAGCSTITPKDFPEDLPNTSLKAEQAMSISEGWDAAPVVKEGKASIVIMTPFSLPPEVKNRKVQLSLEPGATVKDVVAVLGEMGVPILISDEQAAGKSFYMPRFNGTLGQLLSAIGRATDVWFTWNEGAVLVSSTERIAVSVPQDNTFGEVLVKGLDAIGIKERAVTWQAGMASLDVTPSQYRKVRHYLGRMTDNSAFVTLQVAVVNVTLNQNAKQGVDWEKLQLAALTGGNVQDIQAWQKALNLNQPTTGTGINGQTGTTGTNGTTGATGTTGTTGTTGNAVADAANAVGSIAGAVSQAGFAGGALQGLIFTQRFNFSGMFNFLQTYGNAETKQNVLLKTVAGNKVEFKSLTQIPYVKEIGVTQSTGANNNTALGSTQTEKADDGITVEMTPTYDSAANTVTVDMKLAIKAVIAFNELSAGNQLGKLTQPTTAERSFNDILRMRPGQTVVVGGLAYDSISNSFGSPLFLQGTKAESQTLKLDRQSMFIVVRSSVVRIGQLVEESEPGMEDYLELAPGKANPTAAEKRKAGGRLNAGKAE